MNPNLSTSYLAEQAARARIPAQAERGWQIEEAAAGQPHEGIASGLRQWLAAALIGAGERLQRRPRVVSPASPGIAGPDAVTG